MLDQRRRRLSNIVQMLYKCFDQYKWNMTAFSVSFVPTRPVNSLSDLYYCYKKNNLIHVKKWCACTNKGRINVHRELLSWFLSFFLVFGGKLSLKYLNINYFCNFLRMFVCTFSYNFLRIVSISLPENEPGINSVSLLWKLYEGSHYVCQSDQRQMKMHLIQDWLMPDRTCVYVLRGLDHRRYGCCPNIRSLQFFLILPS